MLLQLHFFLDANFVKCKMFENLATKVKNLLSNKQAKKKNSRTKLDKKPVNCSGNTEEKTRIQ